MGGEQAVGPGELGPFSERKELLDAWDESKNALSTLDTDRWIVIQRGVEAASSAPHEATDVGRAMLRVHADEVREAYVALAAVARVPPDELEAIDDVRRLLEEEMKRQGLR